MAQTCEGPPRGGVCADGPEVVCLSANASDSAPKTAPAQADFLLDAIKALSAEEIRADTLKKIPLTLAASGWRSAAALLALAARCADAGDFLNAERNRQRGREQFIEANDAFRQFMEARSTEARAKAFAEAFQ
jgi:hypothetical protein